MTLSVRVGGVWKTVSKMWIRKSGVWKEVERASIWRTHGDPATVGWREFFKKGGATPPAPPPPTPPPPTPPPVTLNVAVSPSTVSGTRTTPGFVTTGTVIATPSGGTAPYQYHWLRTDWDTDAAPTINSPNVSATFFLATVPNYDDSRYGEFKCVVTDANGNTGTGYAHADFIVTHPPGAPAP